MSQKGSRRSSDVYFFRQALADKMFLKFLSSAGTGRELRSLYEGAEPQPNTW